MKGKQEERRELWRQRITQQEKTGQGVRSFCEERGLNENAFYAWRQRFGKEGKAVSFALVKTESGAPAPMQTIGALLTSGDRLSIPTDEGTLRVLLKVLREERSGA